MKRLFLLLTIACAGIAQAQITKNPGDFDELKVFDQIQVELIQSDAPKVEITGKRGGEVEVVNNNGQLKIRMKLTKLLDGDDVLAKVYFVKLNSIDGSEGAYIGCAEPLKQQFLSLNVKEGSQIKLQMEVAKAEVRSVTGGILKLSGSATTMDARLGTGGILEAENLITSNTSIDIKAGGEADVHATDFVNANVKGGGHVDVHGKPKQVNQKTALGGSVNVL